jgi:hypothetical protein
MAKVFFRIFMRLGSYAGMGPVQCGDCANLGQGFDGLGWVLCPAAGHLRVGMREKADRPVSHGALPGRAWWVTSAAFFYNKSYKEPRHE